MNKINFSYASKVEHNFAQRLVIKTIEQLTGKRKLENIYKDFSESKLDPESFWSGILEAMKIKLNIKNNNANEIPTRGSLLMIANHPFGIIDGLILCSIASEVRSDFKIMTTKPSDFCLNLKNLFFLLILTKIVKIQ